MQHLWFEIVLTVPVTLVFANNAEYRNYSHLKFFRENMNTRVTGSVESSNRVSFFLQQM